MNASYVLNFFYFLFHVCILINAGKIYKMDGHKLIKK